MGCRGCRAITRGAVTGGAVGAGMRREEAGEEARGGMTVPFFISTPMDRNWFYDMFTRSVENRRRLAPAGDPDSAYFRLRTVLR